MPRTIQILPDAVANQIAAGEVVERPAAVVKELVENSLDAGARTILVRIEQGGKRTIRVGDDGSGMGREDALLSLDRHATSKIRSAEDLRGVGTFGFRGEALPSIASVSRLSLDTCARGEVLGTRIQLRGGMIGSVEDVARTPGTTITVETLFFNAPARAKFLSSPTAESRAVSEAIIPLALAHPGVAFALESEGRSLLDLPPAADLVERVLQLWGEETAGKLIPILAQDGEITVRGVIQRPDATRPGFRRAHLFVGGRPFREAALLRAADRGYRTTIPEKNRPWLFLFIESPRGTVDVNVHPTKAEVRFRDRKAIEELVERGVRAALEVPESAATFEARPAPPVLRVAEPPPRRLSPAETTERQMALFLTRYGADAAAEGSGDEVGHQPGEGEEERGAPPRLWQVHHAWIVAEVRDGLLLIDQHAAHERILYERVIGRFEKGGEVSQRLLFPLTLRLTAAECAMVEDLKGLLQRMGFEVEGFGGDTVIVHGVPSPHPYFDSERCFREMIAELTVGSELTRAARNQHERLAKSFACKAAIKAGQALMAPEIQELFDQLFATELPYHDVHGRPTTVRLGLGELERRFGR
ncbi:MAG: DNA mismatch repair endonuclease MutL [Gemmatimonadetes bacterium]|nr:DNA mismatch repair endonuclease MutL [Gemmatimonadota bacterium]